MGTLYLVRHGQASFGAEDYDQLSDLGRQQSRQLGAYLQSRGLAFERVLTGSLRRHAQTLEGICEGAGWQLTPEINPALNEYDSEAVIAASAIRVRRNPSSFAALCLIDSIQRQRTHPEPTAHQPFPPPLR